jgi:hypothetical protein
MGRPLTLRQGSGGQVRAPCPITILGTDDLEPSVATPSASDPEICPVFIEISSRTGLSFCPRPE